MVPAPAAALSAMCSPRLVPGIVQVTAGWLSTNFSSTCAQLVQPISPAHAGSGLSRKPAQQATAAEGHVDDHRHAALGRQRQQALLGLARVERVVDLQEVELLGAQHGLDLVVGRGRVVRDADVAHAAFLLPAAQRGEVRAPVDEVVHLHQVHALACAAARTIAPSAQCRPRGPRSRPWWRERLCRAASLRPAVRRWFPRSGRTSASCRSPCRRPRTGRRARREARLYSSLPGRWSKPIQVPQPITGRASWVEGMGRVFMADLLCGCAEAGSAALAHSAAPRRSSSARVRGKSFEGGIGGQYPTMGQKREKQLSCCGSWNTV